MPTKIACGTPSCSKLDHIARIGQRIVAFRLRIIFAEAPAPVLQNEHAALRRMVLGEGCEVPRVAREARKAEQRQPVIPAGIVAIMEAQSVPNSEIAVAKALSVAVLIGCGAHGSSPERRSRLVTSATCFGSALDQTA